MTQQSPNAKLSPASQSSQDSCQLDESQSVQDAKQVKNAQDAQETQGAQCGQDARYGQGAKLAKEAQQNESSFEAAPKPKEPREWFAMKAMGRVAQMKSLLKRQGIYAWAPFSVEKVAGRSASAPRITYSSCAEDNYQDRIYEKEQRRDTTRNLMPLLFFRATRSEVQLLHRNQEIQAYIYRDLNEKTWQPKAIPAFEVKMFRMVRELRKGNTKYFEDAKVLLKKGQLVRITGGEFKGLEGVICRVNHNKCLYVKVTGVCVVAVAYIPHNFCQAIDEKGNDVDLEKNDKAKVAKSKAGGASKMNVELKRPTNRPTEPVAPQSLVLQAPLENNEAKSKESVVLRLSDEVNDKPFARIADPVPFLQGLLLEDLVELSDCLKNLLEQCRKEEIPPASLWLLFDVEEWQFAIADELTKRRKGENEAKAESLEKDAAKLQLAAK